MPYEYKRKQKCRQKSGKQGSYVTKKKGAKSQRCWRSKKAHDDSKKAQHANEARLRGYIRNIILEADDFSCNKHSLGFINHNGEFIDLNRAGIEHQHYLDIIGEEKIPDGWIKVSNANEMWYEGKNWNAVTNQQIHGIIDMWIACSNYSNWIRSDIENFYITLGTQTLGHSGMEELTAPEFLELFGRPDHMDRLFSELLKQR